MKNSTIRKYQLSDYHLCNAFIATTKNANFLFHRDFMEYHSDQFEDYTLLSFPITEEIHKIVLNLLMSPLLKEQEITTIVDLLNNY